MAGDDDLALIRRAALRMLTRRDYSQQEIACKLKQKGFAAGAIQVVIAELIQSALINESRFCENYIYWRKSKGYGPLRISMELQARGIHSDMIAERLQIADNAWLDAVRKVWQKQFKGKLAKDYRSQAKQMRFLQYRGFTKEQIRSVLETIE